MIPIEIQHEQPKKEVNQKETMVFDGKLQNILMAKKEGNTTEIEGKEQRDLHRNPFVGTHNGKLTRGKLRSIKMVQNIPVWDKETGKLLGFIWQQHYKTI